MKKVLILGGGFGGIEAARVLSAEERDDLHITLISDRFHFEYHAALYRVVTGKSPFEVCIPLPEIFEGRPIELVKDKIVKVDLNKKRVHGDSGLHYTYDFLVMALGSDTNYFQIPGLSELSFGFKSIHEALQLKKHLHDIFSSCEGKTFDEKVCVQDIVVVGGGASGVELAGELAFYIKKLASEHQLDPSIVTVNLVEAAPRLLPLLSPDVSQRVKEQLHHLGVNVFVGRKVVREEVEKVYMKDMNFSSRTVIWTAGIQVNSLYKNTAGLIFDPHGKVIVDSHLQAKGRKNVFVIGDAAAAMYSGLAQTALAHGAYVASYIRAVLDKRKMKFYKPHKVSFLIPVGPHWAVAIIGRVKFYGLFAWFLRRLVDFRYFLSILPFSKAYLVWKEGKMLYESCPTCLRALEKEKKPFLR